MTDQDTRAGDMSSPTRAALRAELWQYRHELATLRVEVERSDQAYAALAAALADERGTHRTAAMALADLTLELADLHTAHANAAAALERAVQAGGTVRAEAVELQRRCAAAVAERDRAIVAHDEVCWVLEALRAEHQTLLATRTMRWTRVARQLWGWTLRRRSG